MDGVSASHGRTRRRDTGLAKLISSILRVFNFSKGRNRNVEELASFLLILFFLGMMSLLRWKPFACRFHTSPVFDASKYLVVIRIFQSFRCQIRCTGLHKLIQLALMGLMKLAALWLLLKIITLIWAGQTELAELEDLSSELDQLLLALAVWVFVSAVHRRIRGRNSDLFKLIGSAWVVMIYALMLYELDTEVVVGAFMIWLAMSVLGLNFWIEATGGTVHLQEWGMSLFGHYLFYEETILTWPMLAAVWIGLSAFYGKCETLARDGRGAAHNGAASSLSISTLAEKEVYAFLSVNRGPDVRDEFMDFLLVQLTRSGISVFGDGSKLPKGEEPVEVIKQAKIFIPIISKGYASSQSCLMELSLMLECRRTNGQTMIPIFYDIDPSDLLQVRGSLQMSLKEHEKKGTDGRIIHVWRRALREVGGLDKFYCADKNYG